MYLPAGLTSLSLYFPYESAALLIHLTNLKRLTLTSQMNDKVLLTALTCLEELNIHSWEHFDANEFLCSLTNLTSLGVNLPADTVALLTLTKLESLDLRVKNTDLKFSRLNRLTRLRIAKEFGKRLDPVEERRQDDIVVQHIAHMTSLKYLNVAACLYGDLDIGCCQIWSTWSVCTETRFKTSLN
jgi:hypothetical protein